MNTCFNAIRTPKWPTLTRRLNSAIGGLTVYCFGDPAKMADPNVRLALRIHDECNGELVLFLWLFVYGTCSCDL